MQQRNVRRLAGLALGVTLALTAGVAEAGWGPPGAGSGEGFWGWVMEWVAGFGKEGPCIDPHGQPGCVPSSPQPPAPPAADFLDKAGPCIDPEGQPGCTPQTWPLDRPTTGRAGG